MSWHSACNDLLAQQLIDSERLRIASPIHRGHGGESEFISKLLPGGTAEDLQPLANCGQDVLVFHNE